MTDDTQWTDWIEHKAGDPCPIPDAKACEYKIKFSDGSLSVSSDSSPAIGWRWDYDGYGAITHYRLRKPPVDWKGIAEKRGDALDTILGLLGNIDHSKGTSENYATYRGGMLESIREIATEGKGEAIK